MKQQKLLLNALLVFIVFTILCGLAYTCFVTAFAQIVFPSKANGSIISVDGKKYGSSLLGQSFSDDKYMWGRIMNLDTSTFKDKDGNALMYSAPSNLTIKSSEYEAMVAERVEKIKKANPEM